MSHVKELENAYRNASEATVERVINRLYAKISDLKRTSPKEDHELIDAVDGWIKFELEMLLDDVELEKAA